MQTRTLIRIGIALVAIVVLPWLFFRTLQDTIAEPYTVDAAEVTATRVAGRRRHPDVVAVPGFVAVPAVHTMAGGESASAHSYRSAHLTSPNEAAVAAAPLGWPVVTYP